MIAAAIAVYLLVGLALGSTWLDFWGRRYYVRWTPPTAPGASLVGGVAVLLVVAVCWPLYAWARWRRYSG